jgi:peptidoglycan/xylan/chitin deacetylase (PgdA/CDA1 family)
VATVERVVGLSFDDGPDPEYTPTVLRILSAADAHATFFVTGEHASRYRQLVKHIASSGNELGNHTWSHPHLTDLEQADAISEIDRTRFLLASVAPVRLFRPPYGEISATTLSDVRARGLLPVGWSIPLDHYVDGTYVSSRAAALAIADELSPGDIILAHDARDGGIRRDEAIATLRVLLPLLNSRGYSVVSITTLLDEGAPVPGTPRPWFWQNGFSCPRG